MEHSELEQIAASVAKALGLTSIDGRPAGMQNSWLDNTELYYLQCDGSNLFAPHWRARCEDWLLSHDCEIRLGQSLSIELPHALIQHTRLVLRSNCPGGEFGARAVHHIMKLETKHGH
jgi:hypothetical protein